MIYKNPVVMLRLAKHDYPNLNTDTGIFNQWIEEFLIPELKSGQTAILDNAAFHKSPKTTELINQQIATSLPSTLFT